MDITTPRRNIHTVTTTVALSPEAVRQGGFIEEFTGAANIEYDDTTNPDHVRITYQVVAQAEAIAHHRAQQLIEARAAAGGYAGAFQVRRVVTESTSPAASAPA